MFSTFRSEATLAFWYRLSAGQHQSTSNLRAGINIVSFPSNAAEVSRRSTNFQTCHLRHLRSCAFWTHFLGERRRAPEDDEPRRWILSRRAPPRFLSNFSDRGCRRPPRSRGLDSGDLWKRNAAVQPTHTTPISRYRQHMSTIVKHLFRSGSKKCAPPHRNPCSPSFGTTVHDQWNRCSRRTLRLRVAFDPQFLYPPESGAQVIPVVRLDVLLVQFGMHGLEVMKASDRAL